MKNLSLSLATSILCALFFVCFSATTLHAQQLTKEEQKEWKNKAKDYKKNPAKLKNLVEEKEEAEKRASDAEARMRVLSQSEENMQAQLANMQAQLAQARNDLQAMKQSAASKTNSSEVSEKGLLYKVQIAAFSDMKNQIPSGLKNANGLQMEYDGGFQKIILGKFKDLISAEELQSNLQRIGFKDAFVAAYRDGVRIPLDEDDIIGNE